MTHGVLHAPRPSAVAVLLRCLVLAEPAQAAPIIFEFSGPIFSVADRDAVFLVMSLATYSLFMTWDPDLLPGTPLGGATVYETAPGETSITFTR